MIRFDASFPKFRLEMAAAHPTWAHRALERTNTCVQAAEFVESGSIWSEIKHMFMDLQFSKCMFCERQYESPEYGRIELDVEHFRPKDNVKAWPKQQQPVGQPANMPTGYYWLAHELENYGVACKLCNSTRKGAYFPIEGIRGAAQQSVQDLEYELPLLCYPIGSNDEDPENLIEFVGTIARPKVTYGRDHRRGQAIIDLFGLNNRKLLQKERARMIVVFGPAMRALAAGVANADDIFLISKINDPDIPHANCVRSYSRLWQTDAALALEILSACVKLSFQR